MTREEVLQFFRQDVKVTCDDGDIIEGFFGSYDEAYEFDDGIALINIWRDGTWETNVAIEQNEIQKIELIETN